MTIPAVKRVSEKRVVRLSTLAQLNTKFLVPEIKAHMTQWALEENTKQAKLNPPNRLTSITINRRSSYDLSEGEAKKLTGAKKVVFPELRNNIRLFYVDVEVLAKAVEFAYSLLMRLLVQGATGLSKESVNFYVQDYENPGRNREIRSIVGVIAWIRASTNDSIRVAMQGPTVPDRRKRIYKGRGKQQTKWARPSEAINDGKAIDRYKFLEPKAQKIGKSYQSSGKGRILKTTVRRGGRQYFHIGTSRAVNEIVKNRVRAGFRDVGCYYAFKPARSPGTQMAPYKRPGDKKLYGVNIPEIAFRLKRAFR